MPTFTGTNRYDHMLGTSGPDSLNARGGDDYLNGGAGNDTLTGGRGHDGFGMSVGGGDDVVLDFELNPRNDFDHDGVVFDGWGNFVDAIWSGRLPAYRLADGMTFTTDQGHVLTVHDAGGDTVLTWDTGESMTLSAVETSDLKASWITSLNSYGLF